MKTPSTRKVKSLKRKKKKKERNNGHFVALAYALRSDQFEIEARVMPMAETLMPKADIRELKAGSKF